MILGAHIEESVRIGKHEKKILSILATWSSIDADWEWMPNTGYLEKLANDEDVEQYKKGNRVPLWMIRRDLNCGKTVLARALKTLSEKRLICLYGADLDSVDHALTHYAKFVGITAKGKEFCQKFSSEKLAFRE